MPADPDDFNDKSLRELRQRDPKDEHRDTMQSEKFNSPGDPRIISRLRTLEDKNFDLQGQLSQIKEQLFQVQKQVKEFIDSKTEGQKRKMPEQDQATGTKRQRSTNALENQQQHKDATPTTKDPSSKRPGTIPPIPNPDISRKRWASGKTIGLKLFRTCAEIRHSTRTKGGRACSAAKGVALVSGELSWMAEKIAKLKDDRRQAGGGKSPTSPRSSLHQPPSNALPHPPHSGNNIIFQDPRQMPVQEISADASGLAAQPSYPSSLHTNIKVPSEAGVGAQAPQASL
ncbi:uncharacterized protein IWZ02DRAFT_515375 [Phyllosticta citriasiana]|uniref:uncharacterized protein n=1 Tax=Phyllosticta citriasiana TaxID=595635 RepID=UPI0030FD247B